MTTTNETQLLTQSRLRCNRSCSRRHFYRYEAGIVPEAESEVARVGSGFHRAKEAQDKGQDVEKSLEALGNLDVFDRALVCAMHVVHEEHYANSIGEVIASEKAFELPLRNPETGGVTPIWRLAGVIDRIYKLPDGRLALGDYKVTTDDIEPGSNFWLKLKLDQQMGIYVDAARELGYDVQTILHDVTRRPMLRPYKATPIEDRKYTKKTGELYANQRERDETPQEFAARVAEAMRAEPERYFARHEIAKLESDLDEMRAEIWTQQLMIREMQRTGRWFRNPEACVQIGMSPCGYLSICDSKFDKDGPVPAGFKRLEHIHRELAPKTTPPQPG